MIRFWLMLGLAVTAFLSLGVGMQKLGLTYGQSWTLGYMVFGASAAALVFYRKNRVLQKCAILFGMVWLFTLSMHYIKPDFLAGFNFTLLEHVLVIVLLTHWQQYKMAWATVGMFILSGLAMAGYPTAILVNLFWLGRCTMMAHTAEKAFIDDGGGYNNVVYLHGDTSIGKQAQG